MTVDSGLGLKRCFDAASPPVSAPPGYEAVLGYIGGPLAEHKWELRDWRQFPHLRQFPCYVPDLAQDPYDQAVEAVKLAAELGWNADGDRAIIGDLETEVDRSWWKVFAGTITERKFVPVCYGSLSTVLLNAAERIWAADWDHERVIPSGQAILAGQYDAGIAFGGTEVDVSVLSPELFRLGGLGP